MEVCGGNCLMGWRNGRRFRDVLSEDVSIESVWSIVSDRREQGRNF